jgi:hypothetical protein
MISLFVIPDLPLIFPDDVPFLSEGMLDTQEGTAQSGGRCKGARFRERGRVVVKVL